MPVSLRYPEYSEYSEYSEYGMQLTKWPASQHVRNTEPRRQTLNAQQQATGQQAISYATSTQVRVG